MKTKNLISILTLTSVSYFTFSQTTINIEPPTDDTYIYEANPTQINGGSSNLIVGKDVNGDELRMLIKWDLSSLPSCVSIVDAKIRLNKMDADGPVVAGIYAVADTWNESSVNWSNQPTTGSWYGNWTFSSSTGVNLIPADNLVQDWLANGNNGVMFKWSSGNNGEVPAFESKEASGSDPRLIITYNTLTPPSVNPTSTNTTCGNDNGSITANASSGSSPYTYSWNNGCSASTCSNLSSGTYIVTVTDANGCTATGSATVASSSLSVSPATINVSSSSGDTSFTISANDNWTVSESCSWLSLSPTSGSGNSTITVNYNQNTSSNILTCALTVSCGSSNQTVIITQDPESCTNPTATVNDISGTAPLTMSCSTTGGTGGSILYKWYGGTSCTGTVLSTNSTLSVSSTGNYSCKAYIDNFETECNECDFGLANIITGIEDIDEINNLSIYPNPNTGEFVIELTEFKEFEIKVIGILGEIVYEDKLNGVFVSYRKNIHLHDKGVYFLSVETEEGVVRKKVVVE